MKAMSAKALTSLSFVLALLGLADAWYLAQAALTGGELTCTIEGLSGCNVVAQSSYSRLFGIPLGVYGVAFYAVLCVVLILLYLKPHRVLTRLYVLIAAAGLIASLIFEYIQVALIKALCVYCLGSAVIALLLCVPAWLLLKRENAETIGYSSPPSA
jgi:uncharacterized membrane protein